MKVSFLSVEIRVVVPMIAEAHSVDLFHKNAMFNYIILLTMKSIIKNKIIIRKEQATCRRELRQQN